MPKKHIMKKKFLLLLVMALASTYLLAQPAYDNCQTAFVLTDVQDYCSNVAEFTNINATDSNIPLPRCFPNTNERDSDVWFTFVAQANTIRISVTGNTNINAGGSLRNPQFTLYSGVCNNLVEEICSNDPRGNNAVSSIRADLTIGQTYYIRVDGENARQGSFQLCVNNFNQISPPASDCSDAVLLCDKSSLSIPFVSGRGRREEIRSSPTACSRSGCFYEEDNSVWYKWICDQSGTLTFDITPDNPADDIDFVLYELTGGINDCNGKTELRCMYSGANTGRPFNTWRACTGNTGLRVGETDNREFCGCDNNDNNFLRPADMIEGRAYALIVMNFSGSGAGFSIEFGGTGTFRGPTANFAIDASVLIDESDRTICVNEVIEITDSSFTELGRIVNWQWAFGVDATPRNLTGQGPHRLSYSTPGEKSVALTIQIDAGCRVTEVARINVLPNPEGTFALSLPDCGGGTNGGIAITPSGGVVPYSFSWQGSDFVLGQNELTNLNRGTYNVVIRDAENCRTTLSVELPEDSIQLNESVLPAIEPSCFGFSDGQLIVEPIRGTAPYQFNFGRGFVAQNVLEDIPAGQYTVQVRDANGCDSQFSIEVEQPDSLQLALQRQNISCNGLLDGSIQSQVAGGVGGYLFRWSNGENTQQINNLAAGSYTLILQDANGCERSEQITIIEPAPINLALVSVADAICPGEATGVIVVEADGGTTPYEFSADGINFSQNSALGGLRANTYQVVVRDGRGCLNRLEARVGEPLPFFVDAGDDQTINLGYSADLQAFVIPIGTEATLNWSEATSLSCANCPNPEATPFVTTNYIVTAINPVGCVAIDSVTVFVNKDRTLYIPNVFSPNSDGNNDQFTLFGGRSASKIQLLRIFSRWGELLFETTDIDLNNPLLGWDGTHKGRDLNPGVYVYYAEVMFLDQEVVKYEGDLTLTK